MLPSSPLSLAHDRFSLTENDTDHLVPSWSIVHAAISLVAQSVSQLIGQLDTIAVTFRGSADSNYVFLKRFLLDSWNSNQFFEEVWPACVELALEMPALFPSGNCPPITHEQPAQVYTHRQIACLVVHQFLCTLSRPSWMQSDGSQDFHIWYSGDQPHPGGVHAYLTALFTYFQRVAFHRDSPSSDLDHSVSFTLCSSKLLSITLPESHFKPFHIHEISSSLTDPSLLGLPRGACVISANAYIGFGRTASQEEMHVGSSPSACPAVLITPPLGDGDVLVIRGAEAVVEIEGYGRDARLKRTIDAEEWEWKDRTMLFMDALELDSYDTRHGRFIPDLLPGNVDRELNKAITAFSSGRRSGTSSRDGYEEVVTGLWGCRAFGGNKEIKTLIQWSAASLAGVQLKFICESTETAFLSSLKDFTARAIAEKWTVGEILNILRGLKPEDIGVNTVMELIGSTIGRKRS